jgi:hypothetical protein
VDDGSYVATSPNTSGAKVRYLNADHSAIAETADIFVSKWNEFPLYRHHKNDSPFGSFPELGYYTRNNPIVITGPDKPAWNINVTYSVPTALPTGVAFTGWTFPSDKTEGVDYQITSGTAASHSIGIRFLSASIFILTANFTMPGSVPYECSMTVEPVVTMENITISGNDSPVMNTQEVYSISGTVPPGVIFDSWEASGQVINGLNAPELTIKFTSPGNKSITARFIMPDGKVHRISKHVDVIYFDPVITGWSDTDIYYTTYYKLPDTPAGVTFDGWEISPDFYGANTTIPETIC